MKKLSTLIYALIIVNPFWLCGQQLSKLDSAKVPFEKIVSSSWLDINNNSIHELVLQSEIGEDSTILLSFDWTIQRIDTLHNLVLSSNPIQIEDMDNNNQLDIVGYIRDSLNDLSLTVFYQNAGSFEMGLKEQFDDIQNFYIQDWNKDGLKDLLLLQKNSDSLALSILKNSQHGFANEPELLINLAIHSQLDFLDIDQNGRTDILVTSDNSVLPTIPSLVFNYRDSIEIKESKLPKAFYGTVGLGDYNHDGKMDFFASHGLNQRTTDLAVFINENADFENSVSIDFQDFHPNFSFLADFNSDGLTDIFISDMFKSAVIYQDMENEIFAEIIPDTDNRSFNFYDEDSDGDLDITAISKNAQNSLGVSLNLIDNQAPEENLPPAVPSFHTAFQSTEGVIIVWSDAQDDHTSAKNISYDLFIGENSYNTEVLGPKFDINSSKRLQTARGNNFYGNKLKFDSISAGVYSYGIQPIDNSLTSRVIVGLCPPGSGDRYIAFGEFQICESIEESVIKTCLGSEIVLGDSSRDRYWYSEKEGFLGISDSLSFAVKSDDIIYARDVEFTNCDSYDVYTINIIEEIDFQLEDIALCEADEIELNFSGHADSIKWFSKTKGFLSNDFNTSILFENEDQVRYEAFFNGCLIEGGFSVRFDNSQVKITNKSFQLKRGGSVQLNATGAMDYEWVPTISLNQDNISNPIASPEVTTKYIVRGTSQFGCTSQDTIEVKVLQEAFIPELFTPNGDSRNDRLRIYGLVDVAEFEFIVYDREGNIVFKTKNANIMANSGWDGTKAGTKAEAGIYFWQVRGQFDDGETVQLNGQQKGKVLLSK